MPYNLRPPTHQHDYHSFEVDIHEEPQLYYEMSIGKNLFVFRPLLYIDGSTGQKKFIYIVRFTPKTGKIILDGMAWEWTTLDFVTLRNASRQQSFWLEAKIKQWSTPETLAIPIEFKWAKIEPTKDAKIPTRYY